MSENEYETGADELIAKRIRTLSEVVDEPEEWRVLIPTCLFDHVKDRLDTEQDLGAHYEGISLCYTDKHHTTRVEFTADLSEFIDRKHTNTDHPDSND